MRYGHEGNIMGMRAYLANYGLNHDMLRPVPILCIHAITRKGTHNPVLLHASAPQA